MAALEIGSLRVEVKPNGLVKITITAMKEGVPTSFVTQADLQRALDFVKEQDDDVEDLL